MRGMNLIRLAAATLAVAMAGCTGCGPPEECDNVFITFDSPADGDTVNAPLDVLVSVADKGGNPVELSSATISTRLSSQTEFSVPTPGALETGKATFGALPMPSGQNLVRVVVQKSNSSCSPVSKTIAVTVQDTSAPPEVTAFVIDADTNSDNVLNSAELPANPAALNVSITTARAIGCQLAIKYMGNDVATRAIDALTVPVSIPASALAGLVDAQVYTLLAQITCADGRRNDATVNLAATKQFGIDRVAPSCALLSPSKLVYGPSDDDDPATTGFQLRTLGQAGGDGSLMELILSAPGTTTQRTGPQSAAGGTLSRDFVIPNTGDTQYSVVLEVFDAAGNLCTVARSVQADFVAPGVTITAPTASPPDKTSYNLPVALTVTGVSAGTTAVITTTPSGGSVQSVCGGLVPANGMFGCTGSFAGGAQVVTATVTDGAGNVTVQTVNITVNALGCPFAFTRPATSPVVLTPSNDEATATPDLQYTFTVTSTATCAAKAVTLYRGTGGTRTVIDSGGVTNGSGVYQRQVTLASTNGQYVPFEAEINDGAGNITIAPVSIMVELSIPSILLPVNNATLAVSTDADRATPGAQSALTYQPAPPTGLTATVCSSVALVTGAQPCPGDGTYFVLANNVVSPSNGFTFPDGIYSLKVVFVGGATTPIQGLVSSYTVDTVRPTVVSVGFVGDANADGRLNLAELPTGNPIANIVTTGVPDGRAISVRDLAGGVVGTGTVNGNTAAVTLTGLGLTASTEATWNLAVDVTDAVNNPNKLANPVTGDPVNTAALPTLTVDRVRPTSTLVAPNKARLGIADDAVAGGQFDLRVTATTSTDVGNNGMSFALTGAATQTRQVTPSGGNATTDFSVSNAGELTYTITATATDLAGNVEQNPPTRTFVVDNVAPACTLTAPTAGTYTTFQIATSATVTNGNGFPARFYSRIGAGPENQIGQVTVAGGVASGNLTYQNGTQTVRVEVTDDSGNTCTSSQANVVVNAAGCQVTWTAPATNPQALNRNDDTNQATATTLDYTLTGNTTCPSTQIRLYRGTGGGKTEFAGSPLTTTAGGAFSLAITLPEGPEVLTAEMNNGTATAFPTDVTVDLTLPQVTGLTPVGATFFVVAPGNANLPNAAYLVDADLSLADGQVDVAATPTGAIGGALEVLFKGSVIASTPITQDGVEVSVRATLPHNDNGALQFRVRDQAGNAVVQNSNATIDVIAPGPVTVAASVAPGQSRAATLDLTFGPVYDDGTTVGSGAASGNYQLRWTTETVSPGGISLPADFNNSARVYTSESDSAWSSSAISRQISVPPLNSYYVYVRARDEIGNLSSLVAFTRLDNLGNKVTWTNPRVGGTSSDLFAGVLASGRLNGDGFDDLVVGVATSTSTPNAAFVYYGTDGGLAAVTAQQIDTPDVTTTRFGFDVSVGNVGDPSAGGAADDLLVGAPTSNSGAGRAILYFGTTGVGQIDTSASNRVSFEGPAGSQLGSAAQIIPDLNGDGRAEVALSATAEDSNRGRVYLYYGRTIEAWKGMTQPIGAAAADRVFRGPFPVPGAPGNEFGRYRQGWANIGAFGASAPDFSIPTSRTTVGHLNLFAGDTVNAAAAGAVFLTGQADAGTATDAMQTLGPGPSGASRDGFGSRVEGRFNAVGTVSSDVLITNPQGNGTVSFYDRTAKLLGAPFTNILGLSARNFGHEARTLDFTGDGRPEVVVGEFTTSAGSSYLFVNRGVAGSEFDTQAGAGYFQSKLTGARLGAGMVVGDFDGDGKTDLAIGDDSDGAGRVQVWH